MADAPKKKKRTEGIDGAGSNELAEALKKDLSKIGVDSFVLGKEDTPTDLSEFISTGSSLLDLAISNRPNGGLAVGRIVELNGLEGSGKSLICAHMMANVQKEGGVAVLIDTETAVNEEFFEAVGVDMGKLVYIHENCLEKMFEAIEMIVVKVRQNLANKKKVIIVVDSIANASPKSELEGEYEKQGYGTQKAIFISMALRKLVPLIAKQRILLVFTNQLRMKMNAPAFADPYTTPGGKALPYMSSVRVRLAEVGKIKTKEKDTIGTKIKAKIIKNRFGPPQRQVEFDVYYDRGIDDVSSWISYLKEKSIITGTAAKFTFVDSHGEEHTFNGQTWKDWTVKHPEAFAEIYTQMADSMVMQYNSEGVSTIDGSAEVDKGDVENE